MDRALRPLRRIPPYAVALALGGAIWGLLIVRLSPLDAVLLTGLVAVGLGSLLEPLVGVGAALGLGPLWAWLRATGAPVPPLIGQWVFLAAVAAWIGRKLARRRVRMPTPPLLMPLLAFLFVTLLSLWAPEDAWVGLWEWGKWAQILLMMLLVYDRVQRAPDGLRRAHGVVLALAGAATIQALVGLWQFALRGEGPFAIDARYYRAYGTFEQPNPYAGFLALIGAVLAGMVMAQAWSLLNELRAPVSQSTGGGEPFPWVRRLVALSARCLTPALVLIVAGLGASWSRGGWMGFGAALLVMAAALPRRGAWGVLLVGALVLGGLGLYSAGLLPASIANRLTGFLAYTRFEDVRGAGINDANFAVIERMAHWQAALGMWRARFWLGVGFGCYEPAYAAHRLINWPHPLGHAHNYYLNLLAETGVLGLLAYLIWLGGVVWGLWRATRRLAGPKRALAVGLIGAWTHFATHNLVDNILVNNTHLHLGVLLALSAWLMQIPSAADPNQGA